MPFDRVRAEEQPGADLGVREPVTGETSDLRFLWGERLVRRDDAFAQRGSRGPQLATCALGERLGAEPAQHVVRDAQLSTGIAAAVLPAQPLAVAEPDAGEVHPDLGVAEALDRLLVQVVGHLPL